jgi:hypothetical protein
MTSLSFDVGTSASGARTLSRAARGHGKTRRGVPPGLQIKRNLDDD